MVLLITELTCSVMFYLLYNAFTLRFVDSPVACKGHIMERGLRLCFDGLKNLIIKCL